jgi:hypothetical protein
MLRLLSLLRQLWQSRWYQENYEVLDEATHDIRSREYICECEALGLDDLTKYTVLFVPNYLL